MEANFGRQFQSPTRALYVSFSLLRGFLHFLRISQFENTHKTCLQKIEMSLRILNIFRQSQTELLVIHFHENKLSNRRETCYNNNTLFKYT